MMSTTDPKLTAGMGRQELLEVIEWLEREVLSVRVDAFREAALELRAAIAKLRERDFDSPSARDFDSPSAREFVDGSTMLGHVLPSLIEAECRLYEGWANVFAAKASRLEREG